MQVNPETVHYKLGIHVLLFDLHSSERRYEELEVTNVPDFRLQNFLRILPRRIPSRRRFVKTMPELPDGDSLH